MLDRPVRFCDCGERRKEEGRKMGEKEKKDGRKESCLLRGSFGWVWFAGLDPLFATSATRDPDEEGLRWPGE